LEKYHALVRVERNDFDFNLALRKPELPGGGEERKAAVIAASRRQYARPCAEVEAALLAEFRPEAKPPEPPTAGEPPGGSRKPAPKPTSPAGAPAGMTMPALPPPANPPVSAPPLSAESPKVAEVPKLAVPPTVVEKPSVTDSEKKNREVSPVQPKSTAQSEEGSEHDSKTEHEALKDEITVHAESLDYTVTRETPIPEHGRPDLILTRGKHSIACEISVTTHKTIEADHIRLRLKADSRTLRSFPKSGANSRKLKRLI